MDPSVFRRLHPAVCEVAPAKNGDEAGGAREQDSSRPFGTEGGASRFSDIAGEGPRATRVTDLAAAGRRLLIAAGVPDGEFVFAAGPATLWASAGRAVYHAADLAVLASLRPAEIRAIHAVMEPLFPRRGENPWAAARRFLVGNSVSLYAPWSREDDWGASADWDAPITERDMDLDYLAPKLQTERPGKPGKPLTPHMQRKYEALYQEACERAAADEPGRSAYAAASLQLARHATAVLRALRDRLQEAEPDWDIRLGPLPERSGRVRSLLVRAADSAVVQARVRLSPGGEAIMIGERYPGRNFRNPPFPLVDFDDRNVNLDFLRDGHWQVDCPGIRLAGTGGAVKTALLEIAVNRCQSLAWPR